MNRRSEPVSNVCEINEQVGVPKVDQMAAGQIARGVVPARPKNGPREKSLLTTSPRSNFGCVAKILASPANS